MSESIIKNALSFVADLSGISAARRFPSVSRSRVASLCGLVLLLCFQPLAADDAVSDLEQQIRQIEARNPGELGVYVKNLGTGKELKYKSERNWYLASLVKVPVAIAVLQAAEKNQLSLAEKITLQESDYVDGTGDLLWQEPGKRYALSALLEKSLEDSDSTATDILIRRLGTDGLNKQIREAMVAEGIQSFTTILQVRYDAYGELHPNAADLSNMDYIEIRSAGEHDARVRAFGRKIGVAAGELRVSSLEEAFERYYDRELNTGTLDALGVLLERLVRGELLNADSTDRVLGHMESITTGDRRLKGGLPKGTPFAQKTGSQIERACNMGVTHPRSIETAVVIVVCTEGFGEFEKAEATFQQVASAVQRSAVYSHPK